MYTRIKEKLPELRTKLSSLVSQTQQELNQYGDPAFTTGAVHRVNIIEVINVVYTVLLISNDGMLGLVDPEVVDQIR